VIFTKISLYTYDDMKIAILSDIHSNLEALQACCRKSQSLGVEQYVCLGDIIGYAADPVATLEIVMSLPGIIAVRGNHDEAVLSGSYPINGSKIQQAISWTHLQLLPNHLAFLKSLPYTRSLNNTVFAHASVYQPKKWEYLYCPEQIKKCLQVAECPVVFLGHTHLPVLYYETSLGVIKEKQPEESSAIPLYHQRRYVINVGSVGQPRDGNNAASFVVLDTSADEVTFYRVSYDYTSTARKIIAAGLAPRFAERLAEND